jgi:hypothetical protein
MQRLLSLLITLCVACQGATSGASSVVVANHSSHSAIEGSPVFKWQIWDVSASSADHVELQRRGAFIPTYKGAYYMLYDSRGWRGVSRITGESPRTYDLCEGSSVDAVLIGGPGCVDTKGCIAVGPVDINDVSYVANESSAWQKMH